MPAITFDPATAKVDEPFSVKVADMPTDENTILSVTAPDGNQVEGTLGIEADAEFDTLMSWQAAGAYRYQLKSLTGEVLAEASIEVTQ
jgi:hypothetical protein